MIRVPLKKHIISIALATYNGERYLHEQLMSFTFQTRLPDQLVICDDCSTDKTISILESFAGSAPFPTIIYQNKSKLGTGANFGKAINLCDGDIVAFSDQDDVWLPNKLEKIEQAFNDQPLISYVISDAMVVDERLISVGYTLWDQRKFTNYWQAQFGKGNELEVFLRLNITTGMATAIRSDLRLFGPPPNSVNHDAWYIPLAAIFNHHGSLIKEPLIKYRQHTKQQYGALKTPFKKRIISAFKNNMSAISRDIKLLESLIAYSERKCSDGKTDNPFIYRLQDKLTHLYVRNEINTISPWLRPLKIYSELRLQRYFKYGSWKNIITDVLSY